MENVWITVDERIFREAVPASLHEEQLEAQIHDILKERSDLSCEATPQEIDEARILDRSARLVLIKALLNGEEDPNG